LNSRIPNVFGLMSELWVPLVVDGDMLNRGNIFIF
jgi:hypothetical protein